MLCFTCRSRRFYVHMVCSAAVAQVPILIVSTKRDLDTNPIGDDGAEDTIWEQTRPLLTEFTVHQLAPRHAHTPSLSLAPLTLSIIREPLSLDAARMCNASLGAQRRRRWRRCMPCSIKRHTWSCSQWHHCTTTTPTYELVSSAPCPTTIHGAHESALRFVSHFRVIEWMNTSILCGAI